MRPALSLALMATLLGFAPPAMAAEGALLQGLDSLEVELHRSEAQLRSAATRIRDVQGRLASLEADERELRITIDARKARMARRLRLMYRMRHRGFLELLFSATSAHDLLQTSRTLAWIVRADEQALTAWRADSEALDAQRAAIHAERAELAERVVIAATHREDVRLTTETRRSQLPPIRHNLRVLGAAGAGPRNLAPLPPIPPQGGRLIVEAAPAGEDVQLDLRPEDAPLDLPVEQMRPRGTFARSEGMLPLPVVASIERSGRGIVLLAEAGKNIRAVADGEVSRVQWIDGYGEVAILDHGDGWHTVYGHAESFSVRPGQWVYSGEILGTVGSSGSLRGPRLYFEVRRRDEAQDPLIWLAVPKGLSVKDR